MIQRAWPSLTPANIERLEEKLSAAIEAAGDQRTGKRWTLVRAAFDQIRAAHDIANWGARGVSTGTPC